MRDFISKSKDIHKASAEAMLITGGLGLEKWSDLATDDIRANALRIRAINARANSEGRTGFDIARLMFMNPLLGNYFYCSQPVVVSSVLISRFAVGCEAVETSRARRLTYKFGGGTLSFNDKYGSQNIDPNYHLSYEFIDVNLDNGAKVNEIRIPGAVIDYRILSALNECRILDAFITALKKLITDTNHDFIHAAFNKQKITNAEDFGAVGFNPNSSTGMMCIINAVPPLRSNVINEELIALSLNAMAYDDIREVGFAHKVYESAKTLMQMCDTLQSSGIENCYDMAEALRSYVRYHVGNYVPNGRLKDTSYPNWLPILLSAKAEKTVDQIADPHDVKRKIDLGGLIYKLGEATLWEFERCKYADKLRVIDDRVAAAMAQSESVFKGIAI